jgi:hypothetical protein
MPVVDLASYLGMPQQAPASPVFNQTRRSTGLASLDREADDFEQRVAARNNLYRLSQQAPVLQAQQAQNAYDEVAQEARDLRMKQEIEAQVERAASELAGGNLNPESDDFAVKYRDLATRNPLAFSDQRFRQVAGLYEGQNQNYQQARVAQAQEAARQAQEAERIAAASRQYRRDAIAKGVPAADIAPDATDMDIAALVAKVPKAGSKGNTAEERRLKNIWDATEAQLTSIADRATTDDDPKLIVAQNERDKALAEWIAFNRSGGVPVAPNQVEQQQVTPPGRSFGESGISSAPKDQAQTPVTQAQTGGFKGAMAGATPKDAPAPFTKESAYDEKIKNVAFMDEVGLSNLISTEDAPLADKEKALEALRSLEKKTYPELDADDAITKKLAVKNAIDLGTKIVEKDRIVAEEITPVLNREMAEIDKLVSAFAKKAGLAPENIYRSIVGGKMINTGTTNAYDVPIEVSYIDAVLGDKRGYNTAVTKLMSKVRDSDRKTSPIGTFFKNIFGSYNVSNEEILIQLANAKLSGKQAANDSPFESSNEVDEIAKSILNPK